MTKKQKRFLFRILLTTVLFVTVLLLPRLVGTVNAVLGERLATAPLRLCLFLIPYLVIGFPVLRRAVGNIFRGQVFDENLLMALATVGALAIGEYPEAVFVLLFYEVGELFESLAVGKSRRSIAALMDIRPETATVERDGTELILSPEEVAVGDITVLRPGDRIPLDGEVISGSGSVSTVALTGESKPRDVSAGDTVLSGFVNENGCLRVRVTKPYGESTAAKILRLVEESASRKAKSEAFITRFAAYYTPIVVLAAVALAVIPPLFDGRFSEWLSRALNFLVISCPCALVISVPLSFFAGIGAASKRGVLVKGACYLERLAECRIAVFDKTGTLTEGSFRVARTEAREIREEELLELAAYAEAYSTHPIALSLCRAYGRSVDTARIGAASAKPGCGVTAEVDGQTVYVGNGGWMTSLGLLPAAIDDAEETVIHVARKEQGQRQYLGYLVITDRIKAESREALYSLKKNGIKQLHMLTGDSRAVADAVAGNLPLDGAVAELLPDGKVREVERLLKEKEKNTSLMFVGDGINDAPVLSRADVGVAMGALGADAAIEAADVVIMEDDLRRLTDAVRIARKTVRIVRQNVLLSLSIKFAVLLLSVFGFVSMWEAVFADVGVMVLAVCNAMRAMRP